MALKRNMTRDEMLKFIDDELLPQVKLEIGNWIHPKKRQGGYFVVTRQIFCMIDFLGAAFSGYPLSERRRDPNGRNIAMANKAISYMTTFFEPKSTYDLSLVTQMHDMFRNGLVHLYQPKIIKLNSKSRMHWLIYRGKRHMNKIKVGSNKGEITLRDIHHLEIVSRDQGKKVFYLPTSIDCFYDDFVNATIKYRNKLEKTKYLQVNWRTTVNAILKPR